MRTNLMLTTAFALTLAVPSITLAQDDDKSGSPGAQIQAEQRSEPGVERTQADGRSSGEDEDARADQGGMTPPAGGQAPAAAQAPAQPGGTAEVETTDAVPADDLIGRTVIGADGESLGEVNDILLSQSGEIERVVVGSGGVLGIGEREVAIPWSDAESSAASDELRVVMTKEDFQGAPEYERAESDNALVGAAEE
jgi:sporulation protein YlmC with PRC-barrel domain